MTLSLSLCFACLSLSLCLSFVFLNGHIHRMWKFLGQGLNSSCIYGKTAAVAMPGPLTFYDS